MRGLFNVVIVLLLSAISLSANEFGAVTKLSGGSEFKNVSNLGGENELRSASNLSGNSELKSGNELEDNTFGGWEFVEVNYNFKKAPLFATIYYEHENFQYQRLDCWFVRTTFGWNIAKFLKADVAYDYLQNPHHTTHRAVVDLTGTIKQGNLSVSLRERYIHSWTPETGKQSDVLRSRLKAQYSIPDTKIAPYLAVELFTWGADWKRTRYYVASTYNFTDFMQLELYYIYYTFCNQPTEHVLGVGLNFGF